MDKRESAVPYFSDMQDLGMFTEGDLGALRRAYEILATREGLSGDDAQARGLARALIQLYRHGIRDPESLAAAVGGNAA